MLDQIITEIITFTFVKKAFLKKMFLKKSQISMCIIKNRLLRKVQS